MPIQAPLLLPPRTTHPSTQSSRGVTANAISPRESQIWVYFFARKRNEFLQRRFSDFEKKRRKFSKKNAFPLVSTYIHTHLDLPPPLLVSIQSMPFLWMLSTHSLSPHHSLILRSYHIIHIRLSQIQNSLAETHLNHLFQFNSSIPSITFKVRFSFLFHRLAFPFAASR